MSGLRNFVLDAAVNAVNPNWFPTAGRVFVESVQGKKDPITEKDFTKDERAFLRNFLAAQKKPEGAIQYPHYAQYADSRRKATGEIPMSVAPSVLSLGDPLGNVQTTLGRFRYKQTPNGGWEVRDTYDFNPTEGAAAADLPASGPYGLMRAYAGNKLPPGKGRAVLVNLSPTE